MIKVDLTDLHCPLGSLLLVLQHQLRKPANEVCSSDTVAGNLDADVNIDARITIFGLVSPDSSGGPQVKPRSLQQTVNGRKGHRLDSPGSIKCTFSAAASMEPRQLPARRSELQQLLSISRRVGNYPAQYSHDACACARYTMLPNDLITAESQDVRKKIHRLNSLAGWGS
ncbi:predicted protein [Coccidioides posadasii str. Silveira]|uniref:Predicted protein n=2 Tax=Coccidioides posadasii TaxID=199306 RepID=E9D4U8_COCPS|nr:predicted protein [Coccidioides posadasii str. Silveira]KMM66091.1 hypothetical protein CPAG_02431 [Coccidioides posadasii RMSCC 3488]